MKRYKEELKEHSRRLADRLAVDVKDGVITPKQAEDAYIQDAKRLHLLSCAVMEEKLKPAPEPIIISKDELKNMVVVK